MDIFLLRKKMAAHNAENVSHFYTFFTSVSFHRTLRNSADSGIQHLEPTEQTKQASRTARFGDPKGRVNEDPGAG